jgi:hypothetical protein
MQGVFSQQGAVITAPCSEKTPNFLIVMSWQQALSFL